MLLTLIAVALAVWAVLVGAIVCLCVTAARADHAAARERNLGVGRAAPELRFMARH
jgi:hypothetical protein